MKTNTIATISNITVTLIISAGVTVMLPGSIDITTMLYITLFVGMCITILAGWFEKLFGGLADKNIAKIAKFDENKENDDIIQNAIQIILKLAALKIKCRDDTALKFCNMTILCMVETITLRFILDKGLKYCKDSPTHMDKITSTLTTAGRTTSELLLSISNYIEEITDESGEASKIQEFLDTAVQIELRLKHVGIVSLNQKGK